MVFPYFQLYLLPIVVSAVLLLLSYPLRTIFVSARNMRYFIQYWHFAIWACLLSHFGIRVYYVLESPKEVLTYLVVEMLVTVLVIFLWRIINVILLKPATKEFYEANIMIRWIEMSESIMPKCDINLQRVDSNVFPHTRGCESPSFCISKELLCSLSENGQNYLFAFYLFQIRENHHRYRRLFNFCFICQWYNPVLNLIRLMMNRDSNEICDYLTLEYFGKKHAGNYGLTLIHTFESHEPANPVVSRIYRKATTRHLKWRIGKMH